MAVFKSQKEFSRRALKRRLLIESIFACVLVAAILIFRIKLSLHIFMIAFPIVTIPISFYRNSFKIYVEEISIDPERRLITLHYFQYRNEHAIIQRSFKDVQIDILGGQQGWLLGPIEIHLLGMVSEEVYISAKKDGFTKEDIKAIANLLLELTSPVKRRSA